MYGGPYIISLRKIIIRMVRRKIQWLKQKETIIYSFTKTTLQLEISEHSSIHHTTNFVFKKVVKNMNLNCVLKGIYDFQFTVMWKIHQNLI